MKALWLILAATSLYRLAVAGILLSAVPYITDNVLKFLIWLMGIAVIVYVIRRNYLMVGFIRKMRSLENQE